MLYTTFSDSNILKDQYNIVIKLSFYKSLNDIMPYINKQDNICLFIGHPKPTSYCTIL